MTKNTTADDKPPYPRLGEIIREFALAVDTKSSDKDLDRLARKGEFDWSKLPALRDKLILTPLRGYIDAEFAGLINKYILNLHKDYVGLVSTICLDGLIRDEALPLLIENFFSVHGASLLLAITDEFGGPDLMKFLDPEHHPITIVFDWAGEGCTVDLAKAAYPGTTGTDKTNRDKVIRWSQAGQLPKITGIKLFSDKLCSNISPLQKEKIPNIRRWLLVARAITWLEQAADPMPIRAIMRRHLLSGMPVIDIGKILNAAVLETNEKFSPLKIPAETLYKSLKPSSSKITGDQAKSRINLEILKQLTARHDPEGRTQFHLEWLQGRWHVLSGNYEDALIHYRKATELANYRAGVNQKKLLKETLVLAAYRREKPYLKQLKHWAIAFDLFHTPSGKGVIENWEIEQLHQQFHQVFPATGRFKECVVENKVAGESSDIFLTQYEIDRKKPDLRKPNRIFALSDQSSQTRRLPQLQFFVEMDRLAEVKVLIERGASVDQLNESGESALLRALQRAIKTDKREVLDFLLQQPHTKETLDKPTYKERLTPLICAIEYGDPDVVERLLVMGASTDVRGNINQETPLYLCMSKIIIQRKPNDYLQKLLQIPWEAPNIVMQETLRRNVGIAAGVFGEMHGIKTVMEDSENRKHFEMVTSESVEINIARHSMPKLLRIAELLLIYKADPNAYHHYPVSGRTPLMLAAESNSAWAFEMQVHYGGDPFQMDSTNNDCYAIAQAFAANEVVGYLRTRRIM